MFKRKINTSPAVKKKGQLDSHARTFGIPLEDLIQRADNEVPNIVVKICEYLTETALDLEGIFRVNGNSRIIENLKQAFDTQPEVDLHQFNDFYAIAGLLKMFLRELPSGLIPEGSTIDFTEITDTYKDDLSMCLSEMEALLSGLPLDNYNLLKYLCQFLCKVAHNEFENKMSPTSLGIVFGPNVFRCGRDFEGLRNQGSTNRIMSLFIEYFPSLFKMAAPSNAKIIQVKEYSRDHSQRILPPKSSGGNPRSEDNSMESPRPKPRLSLQVPTGSDVRFSSRLSDEDFRAGSPFSMETENDWSLVSPRVSVDLSSGLQQAIRQCVNEHLFGTLLPSMGGSGGAIPSGGSHQLSASLHQGGGGSGSNLALLSGGVEDDEATVSGTSESIAPTPSPRLNRSAVNGASGSTTLPDHRKSGHTVIHHQHNPSSGRGGEYSSATLPHDSMHLDDLDWPPHQNHQGRRERRHSAEIMDAADAVGVEEQTTGKQQAPSVGGGKSNASRPKAVSRKPKLAFQEISADEVSGGMDTTGQNIPILDMTTTVSSHNDIDYQTTHSPHGDNYSSLKMGPSQDDQSDALRAVTKRIQTLKRNIRQFEESFELEHGWKPGQSQKNSVDEVRQWMLQLAEARRHLKAVKSGQVTTQSSTISLSIPSKPAGASTHGLTGGGAMMGNGGGGNSCPNSTRPLSAVSDVSASGAGVTSGAGGVADHRGGGGHQPMPATAEEEEGGPTREGQTVEETFERLVARLSEKRKQAGRGDVLATMTKEQIEAEKLAIQKALLYFESYHGRPNDRHEKVVMKPLYDRYRLVKRLLQGDSTPTIDRGNSLDGGDTLQRSATMTGAVGGRNSAIINIPTGGGGGGGGTTDFMVTQDWALLRGDRHFEIPGGGGSHTQPGRGERESGGNIVEGLVRLTGNEENSRAKTLNPKLQQTNHMTTPGNNSSPPGDISNKSVAEILDEQKAVKEEKRSLQKILKDFEHEFQKETGHKVNSEDRLPMRAEYNRYKQIKARLKLIESILIKKSTM